MRSRFNALKKAFYSVVKPSSLNQFGSSDLSRAQAKVASSPFSPLQINVMRGFFILMLVTYHIVGSDESSGLKLSDGLIRTVTNGLDFLRMPLITAIGGLVYALKPCRRASDGLGLFAEKKIRRLLVPMLFVGTMFAFVQSMTSGTNQAPVDFSTLHFTPVAHFWYLESLFWIFISIWVLEKLRLLSSPLLFSLVMVVVIAVHTTFNLPATLGLRGWLYLLPYFMFGIALFRFNPLRSLYQSPKLLIFLIGIATVGFVVNGIPENYAPRNTFLFLIIGCSLICVVFSLIPKISGQISGKILGRIGQGSYTIYLFHIFFTAATRIVLKMAGLLAYDYRRINLIAALFAAVIGSLLIEKLARRSSLSSLLLLGEGNLFRLPRKKQRGAGDSGLAWHPSITNRRHS